MTLGGSPIAPIRREVITGCTGTRKLSEVTQMAIYKRGQIYCTSSPSTVRRYANQPGKRTKWSHGIWNRHIAPGLQKSVTSETPRLNNMVVPPSNWHVVRSARNGMTAIIRQRLVTGGCFVAMLAAYRGNAGPE